MPVNKVDLANGENLIDLTSDTVTPETLASGATAHNRAGEQIVGVFTPNVNAGTATDITGILKGNGSTVEAAVEGTDYAPAFSPYQTLSASVTLTAAHFGQYLLLSGASAFTVTLPAATAAMSGAEMELHNIGAGTVTLTGALQLGSTANTSASVTLETGNAVTVKCVGTGAGAWTLIGAYTEV